MREELEANRRFWDEVLPIHMGAVSYDVPGFRAGRSALGKVEGEELGDVRGKTLLQLQCHFGLETLSWAREGAIVTGIDFSEPAIEAARSLAREADIDARFITSDIYTLPDVLEEQFDIVISAYGTLNWLPDLERWAEVVAPLVRPGGVFYLVEFHPFSRVFDDHPEGTDLRVRFAYFSQGEPLRREGDVDYIDSGAGLEHDVIYEWPHPVSEVVSALIDSGLEIAFFHEFKETGWKLLPFMEHIGDGMYRLTKGDGSVPLVYSIKATKPAAVS